MNSTIIYDFLNRISCTLDQGLYRYEISKNDFLNGIINQYNISREKIAEEFEDAEEELRQYKISDQWTVRYNYILEKLLFERILPIDAIGRMIEISELVLQQEILEKIEQMEWNYFEDFVVKVFDNLPWINSIRITRRSKDGGIDFIGTYLDPESSVQFPIFGQVKKWNGKVPVSGIREFIGVLTKMKRNSIGLYIGMSGFTEGALHEIETCPFTIMAYDIHDLSDLMIKYDIGIGRKSFNVVAPDDEFWEEFIPE